MRSAFLERPRSTFLNTSMATATFSGLSKTRSGNDFLTYSFWHPPAILKFSSSFSKILLGMVVKSFGLTHGNSIAKKVSSRHAIFFSANFHKLSTVSIKDSSLDWNAKPGMYCSNFPAFIFSKYLMGLKILHYTVQICSLKILQLTNGI